MSNHLLGTDVETTGLDKNNTSVTEIAFVHYNGEERLSEFLVRIKPDNKKQFQLGALKATNKTIEQLYEDALDPEEAVEKIVEYFVTKVFPAAGNKEIKLFGHNVYFDIVRIRQLLEQYGITDWDGVFSYRIVDTASIGQFLRETGVLELDKMSLGTLAKTLNIKVDDTKLHGALYDIDITFEAYFAMLKLMRTNYGKSK